MGSPAWKEPQRRRGLISRGTRKSAPAQSTCCNLAHPWQGTGYRLALCLSLDLFSTLNSFPFSLPYNTMILMTVLVFKELPMVANGSSC